MRRLATLAVVVALMSPAVASGQDYSFGDWARDHGYEPGDVMPREVDAGCIFSPCSPGIDSLDGIGEFDWTTTPTMSLHLQGNQLSSIESGDFSELSNLMLLSLYDNATLRELNLEAAEFSSLIRHFNVGLSPNIGSVSLRNTMVNQASLATLFDGGALYLTGIGELDGITELDLSGVDFANITSLGPLYTMDDLTDLWLVNTQNVDAAALDVLLDNLETIEGTDTEGVLYITQANFDAFNAAGGGLLAAWDAEPGHHIEFVIPEPSTLPLCIIALGVFGGSRKWKQRGISSADVR
jgi:hypothetical protein